MTPQQRAKGYGELYARFGPGVIAARLLEKWLNEEWNFDQLACAVASYVPLSRNRSRNPVGRWQVALWHVANGHDTNEIARHMGISPETVLTHIRKAQHKLGTPTANRSLLVSTAIRQGLIP